MKKLIRTSVLAPALAAIIAVLSAGAAPCLAGIHYKAVTRNEGGQEKTPDFQVEGWVSGDKARVEFIGANPSGAKGAYLITRDGGKVVYLVNPEEKSYAEWDMQAMLGLAGSIMQGMGPLLKFEVSDPKVEKLAEEDGGSILGVPTRHVRYRTSYTMKVKVLGMGNVSDVVSEQDIWTSDRLQDRALSVWLRSEPPRSGNEQLDKLIASQYKVQGFPLKMVTVTTSTPQKKGQPTVTRSTMEVTQLDTSATVPDSRFEIPAGYQEAQMVPAGEGDEAEQGGPLGGLLRRKKSNSGGN
ncbi:MAG TPA: DUF4412 domain-containing protein [Thermoanaerobaculia bacterium]|nr:DUF4412 domain-containing protein [Thermoanaerobaculia bacterium]